MWTNLQRGKVSTWLIQCIWCMGQFGSWVNWAIFLTQKRWHFLHGKWNFKDDTMWGKNKFSFRPPSRVILGHWPFKVISVLVNIQYSLMSVSLYGHNSQYFCHWKREIWFHQQSLYFSWYLLATEIREMSFHCKSRNVKKHFLILY